MMRYLVSWMALSLVGWVAASLPEPSWGDEAPVQYEAASSTHDEASHDGADHADHDGDAHATGHEGNSNPLSVDPDLMIFTGIIFLLLLAILRKFAWGPISQALADREHGIEAQIAEAHRSNEEARRLLAEHEEKLAAAAESIKEMNNKARHEADQRRQEIIAQAEKTANDLKDSAVREIEAAKNAALEDLAKRSVDQAVGLASRIVGHQLNADDHSRLIQEALQNFPSDN